MAKTHDQFSKKEATVRLEAALRGARLAQAQPMKAMAPKREKARPKQPKTKRS